MFDKNDICDQKAIFYENSHNFYNPRKINVHITKAGVPINSLIRGQFKKSPYIWSSYWSSITIERICDRPANYSTKVFVCSFDKVKIIAPNFKETLYTHVYTAEIRIQHLVTSDFAITEANDMFKNVSEIDFFDNAQ